MTDSRKRQISEAELCDRLSVLPRNVVPQNDPWPRIEQRIRASGAPRRNSPIRRMSLVAGVAAAFAVGIFFGNNLDMSSPLKPEGNAGRGVTELEKSGPILGLHGALAGAEREYQAAFSEFIPVARAGTELSSATIERLESDWQEILEAEAALAAALERYPENSLLNRQMLELRDRQLGLLKQLAGLDRASRRTEI